MVEIVSSFSVEHEDYATLCKDAIVMAFEDYEDHKYELLDAISLNFELHVCLQSR